VWIKICGNTNREDVHLAVSLGADAIGFVFAPSPRQVSPTQARVIARDLPASVERIGVFHTLPPREIIEAVEEAGLTGIQLHGAFDADLVHNLHNAFAHRVTLTQTVHWDIRPDALPPLRSVQQQLRCVQKVPGIARVLIDSRLGSIIGGTGTPFDWNAARSAFAADLSQLNLIVAGGLRPENVEDAITSLDPWGVDVSSGVESAPGRKDPQKLEAFLRKASSTSTSKSDTSNPARPSPPSGNSSYP